MNVRWWNTYRVLSRMRKRFDWSREELDYYRIKKLRELLGIAYHKSPFYRRLYDAHNTRPGQIKTISDLKLLPIVRKKSLLQADPMQIVTIGANPGESLQPHWMVEITSGSTGHPLRIYRTWRDLYHIKAKVIRAFWQTGYRYNQRQVVLKSSTASLTGKHWFERFGILRKYWLSITDTPEENMKRLRKIRPQHLHGYPSGLMTIVEYLQAQRQAFHIPIICTGAEVLNQSARQQIQEAFKAEVFDLYGTREVGNIAFECTAHQGMHTNDDAMIVELLDDNGQEVPVGKEGEVVVTYLDALEYPFIRYALEDRAIQQPAHDCSCGVKFSKLDIITGRSDGRILLPSGKWISGMVFQELRTVPWLSGFRIVQDDRESVRLQVVPKSAVEQDMLNALVAQTSALVNGELAIILEVVDKLEREKSGKLRTVICKFAPEQKTISSSKSLPAVDVSDRDMQITEAT